MLIASLLGDRRLNIWGQAMRVPATRKSIALAEIAEIRCARPQGQRLDEVAEPALFAKYAREC